MATKKDLRRLRIKRGIRNKISGTAEKPRLSVFRSNTGIYAQIIDDISGLTLVSCSSTEFKSSKGTKCEISTLVGKTIAEKAAAKGVKNIVFDRGGFLYHGRVKALAEGAREGGLAF
jgi:large subunit ribosomal protein L18